MSMSREELIAKIKAALDAAENMRHGGFKDGLIAAYDGHAREARAALAALQPDAIREKVVRECAAVCGGLEDYGSDERQAALDDCEAAILKLLERKP